jgi:hypothetical protein
MDDDENENMQTIEKPLLSHPPGWNPEVCLFR